MKLKNLYAVLLLLLLTMVSCTEKPKKTTDFKIADGQFVIDGKPVTIISGEMHYARIPHEYWSHRMKMLKAMGLNTVATYVFWNIHEPQPDVWDFEGDKNLAAYIETAQEEGLNVILRPGPYACAEWEFGGYPWWLQNIEGLELRCDNAKFMEHTERYINRLYKEVGHLQATKGGPIIMVQVENEFGSYASQREDIPMERHRAYNAKIKDQLIAAGFDTPLFTSDGTWLFEGGAIEGVLPTANGENSIKTLKERVNKYNKGVGPYMVAEFYSGWLAHWAGPHPAIDASRLARKTEEYLQDSVSFNFYMVHGGSNFGFTSGANYDKNHDIQPDLTSYDYDAPISEAGWRTPKFDSLRNVIARYVDHKLPSIPEPYPLIETEVNLNRVVDVLGFLKSQPPVIKDIPYTFEQLGQGYGYVLYSRHFNQPISGTMEIAGLRDYASVYLNGEKIGVLNRYNKTYTIDVDIPFNSRLDILVENMGRINYGPEIVNNTKGLISPPIIRGIEITGDWEMYMFPMSESLDLDKIPQQYVHNIHNGLPTELNNLPIVYEGVFELSETGDTFLDMEEWGKGLVFINNRNLGRYWNVGPQQTLYLPGVWLKRGQNTILIFEQINSEVKTNIKGIKNTVLNKLRVDLL
ncbi:MAG: beta-galactosidase [Dysgonomonas sp.]|nr:beta-galactosidase [Dysgonomonas sp.]